MMGGYVCSLPSLSIYSVSGLSDVSYVYMTDAIILQQSYGLIDYFFFVFIFHLFHISHLSLTIIGSVGLYRL